MLAVVLVLDRHLDGGEAPAHGPRRRPPPGGPARRRSPTRPGTPRPGRPVGAPRALLDDRAGCPTRSRRAAAPRGGRRRAPAARTGLSASASSRPATRRTASSSRSTTWGKASRKKPLMRSVTSMRGRPSSASGIDFEAGHPLALWAPRRPDAEQGEGLGDVVAAGAHGGRAPQHQPDGGGVGAGLGEVALDQAVGQAQSRPPTPAATGWPWGRPSRSCARWAARGRRPGSARRSARRGRAGRRARPAGWSISSGVRRRFGTSRSATQRRVGSAVAVAFQPAAARASTRARHSSSTRSTSWRPAPSKSMPSSAATVARSDGTGPWGSRVMASTGVDQGVAAGHAAEHVEAAPDLGVLEGAQVAVDVEHHVVEARRRRAPCRRGRGRGGSRPR